MSKKKEPTKAEKPKIVTKLVRHTFTPSERDALGVELATQFGNLRAIEGDLDQVKAMFKAKLTEAEAKIDSAATSLTAGFAMREERCVEVMDPAERKKFYYLESKPPTGPGDVENIVLVEAMTPTDFQISLVDAEDKFEKRAEIQLFQPAGQDFGKLIVASFKDKWYSALRMKLGKCDLDERLDSEQKGLKHRHDLVAAAVSRALNWIAEVTDEDTAATFQPGFQAIFEAEKERVE